MEGSVSKADFARIYGCDQSYVCKLVKTGKAVTTQDGRRILVEPTLRLIESTRDLSKQGVRDRWDAYRGGERVQSVGVLASTQAEVTSQIESPPASGKSINLDGSISPLKRSAFQEAQTDLARAQAALKQLELRRLSGEVVEAGSTLKAVADFVLVLRDSLLGRADRLAAQLAAESDVRRAHALLLADDERAILNLQSAAQSLARRMRAEVVA